MPKPIPYEHGYRVNFRFNGKRFRAKFQRDRFVDPAGAAEKYIQSVLGGPASKPNESLKVQMDQYLRWAELTGKKKPQTCMTDRQRLHVFLEFSGQTEVRSAVDITVDIIRQFQVYFFDSYPFYRQRQVKRVKRHPEATWEKYRLILSAFLNWCLDRDLIVAHPISRRSEFRSKLQKRRPRWFTNEEVGALLNYFDTLGDPHATAFFHLLAYTGVRASEAVNLKWRSVDMKRAEIAIEGSTKNREIRSIPINSELAARLRPLDRKTEYVLDSGLGTPMRTENAWYKRLQTALKMLGLQPAGLHAFRHGFGAALVQNGEDIMKVKELMGHIRIETTLIYTHLLPEHLKDAISGLKYSV